MGILQGEIKERCKKTDDGKIVCEWQKGDKKFGASFVPSPTGEVYVEQSYGDDKDLLSKLIDEKKKQIEIKSLRELSFNELIRNKEVKEI